MALSTYYHYTVAYYTQLRFIYKSENNALLVGWLVCFACFLQTAGAQ